VPSTCTVAPTPPSIRMTFEGFLAWADEDVERLCEIYVDGPADLVVEIVSTDSDASDRGGLTRLARPRP
jgi:hypothetical protein